MGVQKSPLPKTFEMPVGTDSINVEFFGANRQFDWIEISLVFDKSDKHLTIYDELASKISNLLLSKVLQKPTA